MPTSSIVRIDVITLFPDWVSQLETFGVVGRGLREQRLTLACWNPRDHGQRADGRVDDRPYGGGPGMVMQYGPLAATLDAIRRARGDGAPVILMSPAGERFDQRWAERLAPSAGFILVAGRYEGIDQRFIDQHVDIELSMGDFVLSGGELAAMTVIDAVARLVDGVLGDARSAVEDSFTADTLDHPHYTRPADHAEAGDVPAVLLSGDHAAIAAWREKQALGMTWLRRPERVADMALSQSQTRLLKEFIAEQNTATHDE